MADQQPQVPAPRLDADLVLDDDQDHTVLIDRLPEPDTSYPVIIEATERRVVWVDAESKEDAYRQMRDEPYESWERAEPLDDSMLVAIAPVRDKDAPYWERVNSDPDAYVDVRTLEVGPVESCPECGAVARERDHHAWKWGVNHAKACSRFVHRVDAVLAYVRDEEGRERAAEPRLWFAHCSCGIPGWDTEFRGAVIGETVHTAMPLGVLAELAQAHVAGKPHSPNHILGITAGARPADRAFTGLVAS